MTLSLTQILTLCPGPVHHPHFSPTKSGPNHISDNPSHGNLVRRLTQGPGGENIWYVKIVLLSHDLVLDQLLGEI